MKKLLVTVICCLFLAELTFAQMVVEKTLPYAAGQKIDLQLKFANNIKITASDKKEVYVKVTYTINSGRLNDALLLNFNSKDTGVEVTADLNQELLKQGKAEDCPDAKNNRNHYFNNGQEYYSCSQIDYEINVPRDGNLVVNTINGNIELRGITGPVNAKSISGFVDMSWSGKKGADVALKTITGEVYSDLDISFTNKQKDLPIVGYQLNGNLNGGGPKVKLETISNNIYFRKND